MPYLLDTNVITRIANPMDAQHPVAKNAVEMLLAQGEALYVTPQNLIEFRVIATRPTDANGLGWSMADTESWTAKFEAMFGMLTENGLIFLHWKTLMNVTGTIGKPAHDGRLASVAHVYGVPHILTFNVKDFRRYIIHGVTPVDPSSI